MKHPPALPTLLAVLAGTAVFILLSGRSLPPVVASHFAAGGNANGFMPRNGYLAFMLFMAVGIPLLIALGHSFLPLAPLDRVSLPNRDHWLAPERAAETLAYLRNHGIYLSALLAAFFCFIHWLVVRANQLRPPHLALSLMFPGMAVFLVAVAVWVGVLLVRFSRRP